MASPFLMFPLGRNNNNEIDKLRLFSLKNKNSHYINLLESLTDFQWTNTAFALDPGPCVETWELNEWAPRKMMTIQESYPTQLEEAREIFARDLYTTHWYLTLSHGRVFFVVRYSGKCFTNDGWVVAQEDIPINNAFETLVCPYQTIDFDVFRFDAERRNWIKVESLNEFALFVGGSERTMLSAEENVELEGNSIYFTDDSWDRIHENNLYGGNDMGIFKMD
ncbi:hypothetical protein CDL12_06311 [Handroanthus impetiginosus]|uniref:KIB1-4 beta-propeller domain-containing protein n=1 Tax=Handroanthus impetiginosus TaxID=429701 RepID=A0A2G9HU68_9LAMI|nr:hypothetical protein CDL12_06311 [Handroanthus impetiginosus]